MKKLIGLYLALINIFQCLPQSLLINEIAWSNKGGIIDFQGDSPDWFELYNNTGNDITLAGYSVTDDTSKAEYWQFPDIQLKQGNYLVIFASDKDTIIGTELHTSFKLARMKDRLFLINPAGNIIDMISPVCIPAGYSLSRKPEAGNFIIAEPSPGGENNEEEIPVDYNRDTLLVDHASGFYDESITVSLSKNVPGNSIMYTLDGDDPDEESVIYTNPLLLEDLTPFPNRFANIPETVVEPGNDIYKANILRAVVYSNGCPASNEITNTYFINKNIRTSYRVPLVSVITDEDNLFDDETGIYVHGKYRNFDQHGEKWERAVHLEIFDSTGLQVIDQDAGMRIHGRGSRRSPQKSFRLYAASEYGKEFFQYPFFNQKPGLEKFRVLLMRTTGGTLGPLFKEELCNDLVRNMNIDYPAGETAILFINGEYWGIYNLMERQNEFYVAGNYSIPDPEVDIIAYDRAVVVEEGSQEAYDNMLNFITSINPDADNFYSEVSGHIDLDALTDYYIAQLYFANFDWPFSNVEMWRINNDTARWRYFFFDSDASMIWVNDDHLTEYNNSIEKFNRYEDFSTVILETLLKSDEFREKFFSRFHEHMNSTFRTDRVIEAINRYEKKYAPLVPEHIYRWHNPTDFLKWQDHVDWLRNFAIRRPEYIAGQLERNFGQAIGIYPNPSRGNFTLKILNPAASIQVTIYSVKGEVLQSRTYENVTKEIPVTSGLQQGLYVIQVTSEHGVYSGKLVIQ